jgi:predicted ATPase/DNA-binding CsgD family transcriptional regulator
MPARRATAIGNLPSEVNSFIGREHELARLRALQANARLLSLVGPGGVGKTRLALRLEADLSDAFPDGTWLVDLSPLADPALVPQAVGDVLGVRQPQGQSWLDELARVLRPRRLLVVLDNCEHLLAACAELAAGLLRSCPELRLVVTSLQPLGAAGETTWRVLPLEVPAPAASDIQELGATAAVRLFVARVQAHLPDFALGEHNAPVVAEICRRLDGLPLALELVAARVEGLGLAEVAARLGDRFGLAVGASRTAPARHRTLRAALEWSYGLLDPDEQVLLRRLGVFVGGWTLEGAEAVCAGDPLAATSVVDVLGRLVSKSLVVAQHDELTVRYRLLETVRAYAAGQLAAADETATLQQRHATYLLDLAERSPAEVLDPTHAARLVSEEDNVRGALEWTVQTNRSELGLRLATAVPTLWLFSGHYAEGTAWLDRLLALPDGTPVPVIRSLALAWSGQLRLMLGEYDEAEALGQAALEAPQGDADARVTALAIEMLGNVALQRGDLARAAALHADAGRRMHELGNPNEFLVLFQYALEAHEAGETDEVRHVIANIEMIAQSRRQPQALPYAKYLQALVATSEGRAETAASLLEQTVASGRQVADQRWTVIALTTLGHVRLDLGQTSAALAAFAEAIPLAQSSGERVRLIRGLEGVARCLSTSNADAAVRLAGVTDGQRQTLGAVPWPRERRYLDGWLTQARRVLGSSAYQRAWEDGHASTLAQAVSLVDSLLVVPSAAAPGGTLSPREQEVARLLAQGLTNKQIAAELVVSPATVRSHVEHILDKLSLHSRAQIAAWASQQGLLDATGGTPESP